METIVALIASTISEFIYIEYVIAILIFSELIKKALCEAYIHAKWITFGVAVVFGIAGSVFKLCVMKEQIEFFKMINSFGVACLFYDYLVKLIKDKMADKE